MKILYFVHTYKEKNGISIHLENLVGSLPKDTGIETQVIYGKGGSLPLFSSLRIPFFEFFSALGANFDLMHIHGYGNFFSFFGAIAAILKNKPLVWTIHGYPRLHGPRKLLYFAYRYLMAPVIFWKAKKIISVSADILPLLEKETKKQIEVMPNGVNLDLFTPISSYKDSKYACYVGRLDPDKGVERMLECTSLPLLFIGPDEDNTKQSIEAKAKELGILATFEQADYKSMPSEYEKCRYVILPSKYEGFPLTTLESIAMRRPFICTDVGEVKTVLSELFQNPEIFLLEGNLGDKINELEKMDLEKPLTAARKNASKYSWESIASKVAEIYLS